MTQGIEMIACKLLEVAHLVGLSQSAIARHVGVPRQQVHLWAHGKRVVPKRYREALVTLISEASQQCLQRAEAMAPLSLADAVRYAQGDPPRQRLVHRVAAQIDRLLAEWLAENLEAKGLGPTASVFGVLEALEGYKTMTPAEMRKPANAQRLQALGAYLQEYGTMLRRIGPIQDLVSEESHDAHDHGKLAQPGDADPADPRPE
jgi:transcriptional regulator with XRE-family HTH domain